MTYRFGQIATHNGVPFESALSEDGRALTLTFSDFSIMVDANTPSPVAARQLSLVVPVEGGPGTAEIEFVLSGAAVATQGATITLMVSVNGQSRVRDFPISPDESFVETAHFAAEAPTECRFFALLLAGRDSQSSNPGTAFINILSLDAEFLPRQPGIGGAETT